MQRSVSFHRLISERVSLSVLKYQQIAAPSTHRKRLILAGTALQPVEEKYCPLTGV